MKETKKEVLNNFIDYIKELIFEDGYKINEIDEIYKKAKKKVKRQIK